MKTSIITLVLLLALSAQANVFGAKGAAKDKRGKVRVTLSAGHIDPLNVKPYPKSYADIPRWQKAYGKAQGK